MSLRHRRFRASDKTFEIDRAWEWQQQRRFSQLVAQLRRESSADTCVVVGNGPSLNATDLTQLEYADVFISNLAFDHPELLRRAKLLGVVNHLVAEQASERLAEVVGTSLPVVAPSHLRYALPSGSNSYFLPMAMTPEFQLTPSNGASCQSTVTYFLLQIAYWVGYRKVVLIGVDNRYQQPAVREGEVLLQEGADPNHFSTSYFQGKQWHAADVDRMAAAYELANAAYIAGGRKIVDSTVGGQLTLFPKVELVDAVQLEIPAAGLLPVSRSRVTVVRELLERLGPLLVVLATSMVLLLSLSQVFMESVLSPRSLILVMTLLLALIAFGLFGFVSGQLRRLKATTQFELAVLRSTLNREKST